MANTTIKISQLPNIGANLTPNTLLPLVSTNGTFLTDKITVGNLANYILTEAGNTLQSAFVSDIAYSVANAAQPNITSVGTLANLSIVDVSVLTIPGGTNGYVLQTNGAGNLTWTAMAGSGNGNPGGANSQIQFNDSGLFNGLPTLTFDANTATLNTVNIAASNATIYDTLAVGNLNSNNFTTNNFTTNNFTTTGNIESNYFIGNGSQLTGVTATAVGSGPNLSVQFNNNGLIDGNANLTYDIANDSLILTSIYVGSAGNIYENNNNTALIIRTEPTHIFEIWGNDGATDYKWSFDQDGHLTFPGNGYVRGDVNLIQMYNNSFSQSGVSIFDNFEVAAVADVKIFTNNDTTPFLWTFDNTGNLTLPGNTFAVNYANGDTVSFGANLGNFVITDNALENANGGSFDNGTGGTGYTARLSLPAVSGINSVMLENSYGNVTVGTGNTGTINNSWIFDTDGKLNLASGNSVIQSVINNAGDGSGLSTLNLYPDSSTGDDRYLIVDPTGPNHLHLRAGGVQDSSTTLLYLGGEQAYVQIDDFNHRVAIGSYDSGNTINYQWLFTQDGNLQLPVNTRAINFANGSPAFDNLVSWTTAPVANTSTGTPGQAAYDSGGNLYVCVATDTWAKFAGTTSW